MDTQNRGKVRTMLALIADGTVIEAGDFVGISAGLIIKATATSPKVARATVAHASGGGTTIEITKGRAKVKMDSEDAYAVSQGAGEYDIAIDGNGKATINQSGTSYKVLMMDQKQLAAVGASTNLLVTINRPIDDVSHPTT